MSNEYALAKNICHDIEEGQVRPFKSECLRNFLFIAFAASMIVWFLSRFNWAARSLDSVLNVFQVLDVHLNRGNNIGSV